MHDFVGTTWTVTVYTADVSDAGTDGDVSIIVYGDKDTTKTIILETDGNNFNQGIVDRFTVNMGVDIGKPKDVRVIYENFIAFIPDC
jgi:hypothetical protein